MNFQKYSDVENKDLKEYYDQQYNKDGQGPPFEQLPDEQIDSVKFSKSMRDIRREINLIAIKIILSMCVRCPRIKPRKRKIIQRVKK